MSTRRNLPRHEVKGLDLIAAWRSLKTNSPPYLLPGDEAVLGSSLAVTIRSEQELLAHPGFDFQGDGALHLGLLPIPFAGSLTGADIFVLLLNPGFRPSDYFAEFRDEAYRGALVANLAQRTPPHGFHNPYLDPRFSYHGGYEYWRGKLKKTLDLLIRQRGIGFHEALRLISQRVAILELFPYHSSVSSLPRGILGRLRSTALVQKYVQDTLLPRARSGNALIVVTRQAALWGLQQERNVVVYEGTEARSAHLTPNSRGGRAILKRLSAD